MRTVTKPPAAPKAWAHGLCSCFEDMNLTCSVCWCQCNATGQAFHRATGSGCFLISVFLWALFIITQILQGTVSSLDATADPDDSMVAVGIVGSIAGFLGLISAVATTYFVCTSRRIMRERDQIPTGWCGGCDDCCVGWWCGCCALIQMFRQDSITGQKYRLCAEEAV